MNLNEKLQLKHYKTLISVKSKYDQRKENIREIIELIEILDHKTKENIELIEELKSEEEKEKDYLEKEEGLISKTWNDVKTTMIEELKDTASLLQARDNILQTFGGLEEALYVEKTDKEVIAAFESSSFRSPIRTDLKNAYHKALAKREIMKEIASPIVAEIIVEQKGEEAASIYIPVLFEKQDEGLSGVITAGIRNSITIQTEEFYSINCRGILEVEAVTDYKKLKEALQWHLKTSEDEFKKYNILYNFIDLHDLFLEEGEKNIGPFRSFFNRVFRGFKSYNQ